MEETVCESVFRKVSNVVTSVAIGVMLSILSMVQIFYYSQPDKFWADDLVHYESILSRNIYNFFVKSDGFLANISGFILSGYNTMVASSLYLTFSLIWIMIASIAYLRTRKLESTSSKFPMIAFIVISLIIFLFDMVSLGVLMTDFNDALTFFHPDEESILFPFAILVVSAIWTRGFITPFVNFCALILYGVLLYKLELRGPENKMNWYDIIRNMRVRIPRPRYFFNWSSNSS